MDDALAYYWSLPILTRSWLTLSVGLTAAASLDLVDTSMLVFDWDRIYNHLELWRLLTSFCFAHGHFKQFHVLIVMYLILNIGRPYELRPLNAGAGGTRADAAFAGLFCAVLIATTNPLLDTYGRTLLFKAGYKRTYFRMEPVFTRSLVYAILYLWSRKNPNARADINMVPMPGKYLPFAHIALGWLMKNRLNETIHGIVVGHVFFYLTTVVPAVTHGRMGLKTPQFLIDVCAENQVYYQEEEEEEEEDNRRLIPPEPPRPQYDHPHQE